MFAALFVLSAPCTDRFCLVPLSAAFMSGFNPIKFDVQLRYSPTEYVKHLQKDMPQVVKDLAHHTYGLARATVHFGFYMVSFVNPFAWFSKSKYK